MSYFTQEILTPTHNRGNILDILLTNNSELLHSYESNEILFSDHYLIEGKINYKSAEDMAENETNPTDTKTNPSFDQLNFFSEKINWKKINEEFQRFNWKEEFRGLRPEEMLNRFLHNMYITINGLIRPQGIAKKKMSLSKISKS